jgi:hypothetical protein
MEDNMEEQIKVKVTEKEAKNYIIKKLRNRKVVCSSNDNCLGEIASDNFGLEIRSTHYAGWYNREETDYAEVNLQISTVESPHIRRRLPKFNIKNGNYNELSEKVKFIIKENMRLKQEENKKEKLQRSNLELLGSKLRGTGARHIQEDNYYLKKTKYGEFTFYAHEDRISVDFEENNDMTLEQGIEMLNKLQ